MPRLTPRMLRRSLAVALVSSFAILPAAALAAQPVERYHDHFTDSFSDQLCGIDVDVALSATDTFSEFADGSFKDTRSMRGVVTNPLNGKAVILSSAGQVSVPAPVIDELAGTITFRPDVKGLPLKVQAQHGAVLLRDAGMITFSDTFDLATAEPISQQVLVQHGPHPQIDSDGAAFCEVISGALA